MVIDDSGSVEGIYAFINCTKWRSGRVSRMPYGRTHLQTLKDSANQLPTKYKSGALVTQLCAKYDQIRACLSLQVRHPQNDHQKCSSDALMLGTFS